LVLKFCNLNSQRFINLRMAKVISDPATLKDFEFIFSRILSLATTLAGLVCFIMLIIGGFKYLTSTGDPKQTASAKGTITWAIVGLVIIIGSWFVLQLIEEITGVRVTIFEIPIFEKSQ